MFIWDYNLPNNWRPQTPEQWEWYLVRKINYNDLAGLKKTTIKEYFLQIKNKLDTGKRILLEYYLSRS